MGKSNYKKLPNRKNKLLTLSFLEDLKENIIAFAKENDRQQNRDEVDYNSYSYSSFYSSLEGTRLFHNALHETCKKHNVVKAIYEYYMRMCWCDSDCFGDDILFKMVQLGIVDLENELDGPFYYEDDIKYSITRNYKGYSVSEFGYWDKYDKSSLEEIYNESNVTITWLD